MVAFNDRRPFFHGTDVDLNPGDHITPASTRSATDRYGIGSDFEDSAKAGRKRADWAFASSDENTAWRYGHSAARGATEMGTSTTRYDTRIGTNTGRSKVYQVEPVTEPLRGPEYYEREHDEHVSKAWRVVKQIDNQPGGNSALPGVNWNEHRDQYSRGDANHPGTPKFDTLSHYENLPAMAGRGQLDLFNNRAAGDQANGSHDATPEERYHLNSTRGVNVDYQTTKPRR